MSNPWIRKHRSGSLCINSSYSFFGFKKGPFCSTPELVGPKFKWEKNYNFGNFRKSIFFYVIRIIWNPNNESLLRCHPNFGWHLRRLSLQMVKNQRNLCRFRYLDNAIFLPYKIKLVQANFDEAIKHHFRSIMNVLFLEYQLF